MNVSEESSGLETIPLVGLLGQNIGYSLSPMLHEAADRVTGPIHDYQLFDIPAWGLENFLKHTGEIPGLHGFNVTVPHKSVLARRLSDVEVSARETGAVNVVKLENGELVGYNTDRPALVSEIKSALADGKHPDGGWRVVLMGSGGAARAVVWAFFDLKAADEILVMSRDDKRLDSFVNDFVVAGDHFGTEVKICDWLDWEGVSEKTGGRDVMLVNATPLGTMDLEGRTSLPVHVPPSDILTEFRLVLDLVYSPAETVLMGAARNAGVHAVGGRGMLIEQAVLSRSIWFGPGNEDIERAAMRTAFDDWMKELIDKSEGRE